MNIDRGKESFTAEEEHGLQVRLREFKDTNGFSWNRLCQLTGIAQGTLSVWVTGRYNGGKPSPDLSAKINRFFLQAASQDEIERDAPVVPSFQSTKTAKRVIGTLAWAHRGKLTVIVGDPGVGKSAAADQYVGTATNAWKATMSPSTASVNATLLTILRSMGAQRVGGAGHMLAGMIRERVTNRHALLVIDEAQHMSEPALEEVRAIHDETKCGLVLMGNREVLTRVEGAARQAAFAQLYSRISVRLIIAKPHPDDVAALLAAWQIEDPKEREFLARIALTPGGGGVRSMTNTLEYATIMAQDDEDSTRVLDHLKDAWAALSTRTATA